jgi:uncharacterized protein with FMN-binding domain
MTTRRITMRLPRRQGRPVQAAVLSAIAAVGPVAAATAATTKDRPQASAAAAKVFHGSKASMRWGIVQVTITVVGRRITAVTDSLPEVKPGSKFINQRAEPTLRRETLQAQSAKVRVVSGATLTSRAWAQSLQYALAKAHL